MESSLKPSDRAHVPEARHYILVFPFLYSHEELAVIYLEWCSNSLCETSNTVPIPFLRASDISPTALLSNNIPGGMQRDSIGTVAVEALQELFTGDGQPKKGSISPKCLSKAHFKFYTNESGKGSSLPQNVRTNKLYELLATIYFSYYISLGFNAGATRRCHFKKLVKNLAKKYHTFLAPESVIKQIPRLLGHGLNKAESKVNETKAMVRFQVKKLICMGVDVGNVTMEEKQIFQNVQMSIKKWDADKIRMKIPKSCFELGIYPKILMISNVFTVMLF
ncbi:hypothetical protein GQ457_16G022260 [Hibiscus cannabinus]